MTFAQPFSGYEILARVGAGAMGTVFRARQKHMNRIVALKVLKPSLARNSKYVERLRREARIVGRLNHPNIVTGYDLGEEGGYHFFVMEFIEGQSLRSLQAEWGWFPEQRVLDVGIQVAEALDHAFLAGVIHRDVKPGNILIDQQGRAKLTDMGLAKGPTDLTLTRDGATVGTPQFLSPEQARDPQSVDIRGDLYSLGATLYQMSTGIAPFSADTIGELIHQVLHDYPPDARAINPQLSEGMGLVIKKLLMKDPALRYQTPRELLDDLKRVQRDERPAVDARRLERAARRGIPLRQRRAVWYGATALAVVCVAAVAWSGQSSDASGSNSTDDPATTFGAALRQRLEVARDTRAKLVALADYRSRASSSRDHAMVDRHAAPVYQRVKESVDTVLREFREWLTSPDAERLLNHASSWRATTRQVRERLTAALFDATSLRPNDLPPSPRAVWDHGLRSVDDSVDARVAERNRLYRQAFVSFLSAELGRDVEVELATDQFENARRTARRGIAQFHGRAGRPALGQLNEDLRARVTADADEAVDAWMRSIDDAERRLAGLFRLEVDEEVASLRADLAKADSPEPLALRLRTFRTKRIVDAYPGSAAFGSGVDPWPKVEIDLSRVSREIDGRLDALRIEDLRGSLSFAYRVLASSSVDDALEFLRDQVERLDVPEGGGHVDWIEAAREARDAVLTLLVDGVETRDVPVRHGEVRVTRVAGTDGQQRFLLADADTGVALPFAVVAGDLLGHVHSEALLQGESERVRRLRAGLALWWLYAADEGKGLALLQDAERRDFLITRVAPIVRDCPVRSLGAEQDGVVGLLLRLQRARERERLADVRSLLQELDALPRAGLEPEDERLLQVTRHWLQTRDRRAARLEQLSSFAPPGAVAQVSANGDEEVAFGPQAIWDIGLHHAWTVHSNELQMGDANLSVPDAEARRIELPTVVSAEHGVESVFDVRFGATGSRPHVVIASLLGITCVLVVLPNGLVLSELVEGSSARGGGTAGSLRRVLADLLATTPDAIHAAGVGGWVTAGAYARVRLQIVGVGRTHIRVWLDDALLCERRVHVPADAPGRVRWMPFQPVGLRGIEIRGATP